MTRARQFSRTRVGWRTELELTFTLGSGWLNNVNEISDEVGSNVMDRAKGRSVEGAATIVTATMGKSGGQRVFRKAVVVKMRVAWREYLVGTMSR